MNSTTLPSVCATSDHIQGFLHVRQALCQHPSIQIFILKVFIVNQALWMHAFNPNTQEAEQGLVHIGGLALACWVHLGHAGNRVRLAFSTLCIPGPICTKLSINCILGPCPCDSPWTSLPRPASPHPTPPQKSKFWLESKTEALNIDSSEQPSWGVGGWGGGEV